MRLDKWQEYQIREDLRPLETEVRKEQQAAKLAKAQAKAEEARTESMLSITQANSAAMSMVAASMKTAGFDEESQQLTCKNLAKEHFAKLGITLVLSEADKAKEPVTADA